MQGSKATTASARFQVDVCYSGNHDVMAAFGVLGHLCWDAEAYNARGMQRLLGCRLPGEPGWPLVTPQLLINGELLTFAFFMTGALL